jgi:hypothetical protein
VVTSHGLREIAGNHLTIEMIAKWAIELMGLDIMYVPQTAIKSQSLVVFGRNGQKHNNHLPSDFNGSFTLNGVGGGVILISPKGDRLLYVI